MSLINKQQVVSKLNLMVSRWDRDDMCVYYNYTYNQYAVMNKSELHDFMKQYKEKFKQGIIYILPENNNDCTISGKKFYSLTIQSPCIENMDVISCFGLDNISTWITGHSYFFTNKKNRDAVYNYFKKFSHLKLYESDDESDVDCGICLDNEQVLFKTTCCKQIICHMCNYTKRTNVCAFCRHEF